MNAIENLTQDGNAMTRHAPSPLHLALLLLLAAPAAQAAEACQPIIDAYAAQAKAAVLQKTVTTPGMADPAEYILTQEAMYSRVGAKDVWLKNEISDAVRAMMAKRAPGPHTIGDCRTLGPQAVDGITGTAYEFTPSGATGNVPGERMTVLIDDKTGLPVSETALKAGTVAKIVYDGVAVPAQ